MGENANLGKFRNVCFAGHGHSGKTTLTEALLFLCKTTTRQGSVDDGTALSDYLPEEKERNSSINAAILHSESKGTVFHWLDVPGFPDFLGEAVSGIRASDIVLLTVPATSGVSATTRKVFRITTDLGKAVGVVLTKMDGENIEYGGLLTALRDLLGTGCIPMTLPDGTGTAFTKVVDVLDPAASGGLEDAASWREKLMECAVETDDALLEKYLEGEEIGAAAMAGAIRNAVARRKLIPVFAVASPASIGVAELLEAVRAYFPSPATAVVQTVGGAPLSIADDGPFVAQVFKSITDDYVGRLTFFRAFSGRLQVDDSVTNARTGKTERVQNLFQVQGKEQTPVDAAEGGGIYAVSKIETFNVSDTLYTGREKIELAPLEFPNPMVSLAVEPKSRGDEQRISGALAKISEEDPTFDVHRDRQTGELLITGLSQLHLDLKLKQMKRRFNVEVSTKIPKVPYRETITAKGDARYRHKKQTGGAGQFAEVWMRIEPLMTEDGRHGGFEYASAVVGGAISQSFIPSIEKGVKQVLDQGPVAGYPVDGVKAIVYDGKEHPVDSKDIAFQIAGREVFKAAITQAKAKLLEPIMNLEVSFPSRFMGDITADLNSRRGRIMGMNAEGDLQIVSAQVPLAEMLSYSTELKSMTQDEGAFTLQLSHYEIVPDSVAQAVIQRSRQEKEEDKS